MKLTLFDTVANTASCSIVLGKERGVMTVKGDDGRDIETTMKKLDNVAAAYVSTQISTFLHGIN